MLTVLLVGENELLQQTRAAVLRMMGADVICSSPDSAPVVQEDRNCDLVVLCHSLREPFSASLAETIRSRWPNTRILQVTSSRIWEAAEAVPAVDAISSADPERLIMRAVELGAATIAQHSTSRPHLWPTLSVNNGQSIRRTCVERPAPCPEC
jgi:DNA-binding NarL/FixJ family response regulator